MSDERIEEWRPACGFEHRYEVSDMGRVRRLTGGIRTYAGRILTSTPRKPGGYWGIRLLGDDDIYHNRYVHRLVVEAFHGKLAPGLEVDHIDGIKSNNHLANLEVVTMQEHYIRAVASGQNVTILRGEKNRSAKLNEDDVRKIREMALGESCPSIARRYGVDPATIYRIVKREKWGHVA